MPEPRTETEPRTAVPLMVHLLRRVSFAYSNRVEAAAAAAGLHLTDLRALVELLDAERNDRRLHAGDLGTALGMTTQATTALLNRLEGRRLVERHRAAADRRQVELHVTGHALELGWRQFGSVVDQLADAVDELPDADRLVIERFLQTALAALTLVD